jgi:DNA-binding NtrC family response regulator
MDGEEAIVCVDDEVIILMSLKQELLQAYRGRFRVETALGGAEALSIVDELSSLGVRVVLILTDWLMPGIKGDALVAEAKSRHPDIKCILISGQASTMLEEALSNDLLDGFVRKPWSTAILIRAIDKCFIEG